MVLRWWGAVNIPQWGGATHQSLWGSMTSWRGYPQSSDKLGCCPLPHWEWSPCPSPLLPQQGGPGRLPWGSPPASSWWLPAKKGSLRFGKAGWLASDHVAWKKKDTTNPLTEQLKVSCRSEPLRGLLGAERKKIGWSKRLWWTGHPSYLKDIQNFFRTEK